MPEDFKYFTWGEMVTWLIGWELGQYGVVAGLLRQIGYQQITLNPYIDRMDKPYSIFEYISFPTDEVKRKTVEYIDPKELERIWSK